MFTNNSCIAGGNYGLARVTAGIYAGYLVACLDTLETIIYVATSAVSFGSFLTTVFKTSNHINPVYWLLFYVSATAIHCYGGLTFWRVNMVLAVVSVLVVIWYVVGSAAWADFDKYAPLPHNEGDARWFAGSSTDFMTIIPLPCWFFVGVEFINLACQDIKHPKVNIPAGYLYCIATLVVTCIAVFLYPCL